VLSPPVVNRTQLAYSWQLLVVKTLRGSVWIAVAAERAGARGPINSGGKASCEIMQRLHTAVSACSALRQLSCCCCCWWTQFIASDAATGVAKVPLLPPARALACDDTGTPM
jgi:hypothetical protein